MQTRAKQEPDLKRIVLRVPVGQGESTVTLIPWGARVLNWVVPLADGARDILLGPERNEQILADDKYFGATVGRVANRIGGAVFSLEGETFPLEANNAPNHLHGGHPGFHELNWTVQGMETGIEVDGNPYHQIALTRISPAGEAGYPGTLTVGLEIRLTGGEEACLTFRTQARTDAPTPCSLTWHGYFNLEGYAASSIETHSLQIWADEATRFDEHSCPTGELIPVAGTGLDYRRLTRLSEGLSRVCPYLEQGRGLDHNYVINKHPRGTCRPAARLIGGGLELICETTQPGLQVYTANYLEGDEGKLLPNGSPVHYGVRSGICLETQAWPDAIHHTEFPSVVLRPDEVMEQETRYRLRCLKGRAFGQGMKGAGANS